MGHAFNLYESLFSHLQIRSILVVPISYHRYEDLLILLPKYFY